MKNFGKILGINLLILLGYSLLIFISTNPGRGSGGHYAAMDFAFLMMIMIGFHVLVNLIMAIVKFIKKEKELGASYLVSLFIVSIVGFSSCMGGSALI